MNLKDFGPEVRTYIRNLSREQLDELLRDAGVHAHEIAEAPEVLRYTCATDSVYRLDSAYRVISSYTSRVA